LGTYGPSARWEDFVMYHNVLSSSLSTKKLRFIGGWIQERFFLKRVINAEEGLNLDLVR
jgi:hypothetical protein